jgi:filamentous hemagglutinin
VGGAFLGTGAVIMAPAVVAAAGDVLVGAGVATGSTALFGAGMSAYGTSTAVENAMFGTSTVPPPTIKPGAAGGPTTGKPFPESVRQQAFDEDPTQTCVWCGIPGIGTQVDHAIPMSLGGNATIDNAQLACHHCNASRGARAFPLTPPDGYRGAWPPPWWPHQE